MAEFKSTFILLVSKMTFNNMQESCPSNVTWVLAEKYIRKPVHCTAPKIEAKYHKIRIGNSRKPDEKQGSELSQWSPYDRHPL